MTVEILNAVVIIKCIIIINNNNNNNRLLDKNEIIIYFIFWKACLTKCYSCINSADNCLKCSSYLRRPNPPICSCLDGYFES
jgi:hypothetical protein